MSQSTIGPRPSRSDWVPNVYKDMVINTEFDLHSISDTANDHVLTSAQLNNYITTNPYLYNSSRTKSKRNPCQASLFDYLPPQFQERYGSKAEERINQEWGKTYIVKSPNTIRIRYTNPNGLGINPNSAKSHSTFSFLYHKSMADIICLAETNLNWPILVNMHTI